jgi:predicted  nucleic acid-binding Zn-ribbon protein
MYGGLGKVGLDHEGKEKNNDNEEELAPTFSASALRYVSKIVQIENEDDDLLNENLDELDNELDKIDEEI